MLYVVVHLFPTHIYKIKNTVRLDLYLRIADSVKSVRSYYTYPKLREIELICYCDILFLYFFIPTLERFFYYV